jgi:hypothetical protein
VERLGVNEFADQACLLQLPSEPVTERTISGEKTSTATKHLISSPLKALGDALRR